MPELPDLQAFSKNLTKMLKGKVLEKAAIHNKQKTKVSLNDLQTLEGKKLIKVYREGKRLFFDFGKDAILSIHLMLHGKLVYSEDENPKYALVSMKFKDGGTLSNAYADEILYEAGISPLSISNKIPEQKVQHLAKAIKEVLSTCFFKFSLTQRSIAILKPFCALKKELKNDRRSRIIRQIIFLKK